MNKKARNNYPPGALFRLLKRSNAGVVQFRLQNISIGLLIAVLVLSACDYKVESITPEDSYHPTFSLPIGEEQISLDEFIQDNQLLPIPPENINPDDSYFETGGIYYPTPVAYDTIIQRSFSLDQAQDYIKEATQVMFRTNCINYSHAAIAMQFYFLEDGNPWPTDSLYSAGPLLIPGGTVKTDGSVTPSEKWRQDETFSPERINGILNTTNLRIAIHFEFPQDNGVVHLNDSTLFWLQLGLRISLDINPNE
jgi:hypothetical protein